MGFGSSIGTACATFAITNIDDIFVLVTFFAEATTSETLTPLRIVIGQYLGFTVIVAVSMIGFAVSQVLPAEPIGFLGYVPMLLGVGKGLDVLFPLPEEDEEDSEGEGNAQPGRKRRLAVVRSTLKVSMMTVVNGGDNVGTYVPIFSEAKGAEIAIYVVTYYILLGIWCLAAWLFMRQRHILKLFQRYADTVIPLLYIGLGIYIVVQSECYPWTIQRINESDRLPGNQGTAIMAPITACLLVACISALLVARLRKIHAQRIMLTDRGEDVSPRSVAATSLDTDIQGASSERPRPSKIAHVTSAPTSSSQVPE